MTGLDWREPTSRPSRCGWGGDPPCPVMLPRRGLCDEHHALIQSLGIKVDARRDPKVARREPAAVTVRRIEPEAKPSAVVADYNARRADEAAARRERVAAAAIEAVAEHPPVPLVPLAERLGVSVPLLRDAVKLAEQRQQLKTVPGGGRQSGVWPFDLAPETADERRAKLRELLAEGVTSRLEVRDRTGWTAAQLQNALRTLPDVHADGDTLRLAAPEALAA